MRLKNKMPISINNPDSFDNDNDKSWLKLPHVENHLKSFSEVYFSQCENQSLKSKIMFMSIENECMYNQEALLNDPFIKNVGMAVYSGANERISDIIKQSSFNNKYALKAKYDCSCSTSHKSKYRIKLENWNESKPILSTEYANHEINELVISKQRYKKLLEIEDRLYDIGELMIDYKPKQIAFERSTYAINSAHMHISTNNEESNLKLTSRNGIRFIIDLQDYIIAELGLWRNHNMCFRFSGKNDWCKYGDNTYTARSVSKRNSTHYDRYFGLNDSYHVRMNHGTSTKKLKTLENRAFAMCRDKEMTHKAIRFYHNGINKFLAFYKDISAYEMLENDLYLRIDNKVLKGSELITPYETRGENGEYLTQDKIRENNGISLREIRDQYV